MLNRVNKLLIGKDIARTAGIVLGDSAHNPADGEILVLDENKAIMTAGQTFADTKSIYIGEGVTETYDYVDPSGTAVTGVRKLIFSDPIEGKLVKGYSGQSYVAKAEQSSVFTIAGLTPVVGTEYIVRIIYKDIPEHPGSFTQTYRYISATADLDVFGAAMTAKIMAHSGRRVSATYSSGADTLTLAGLPIPDCTSSLANIDEFSMVEFTPLFLLVSVATATLGEWQLIPATAPAAVTTAAIKPQGSWEVIRDVEKAAMGYKGISNRIHFPIITPDFRTVKAETYDQIVIEHDKSYQSPDNQYVKQAPLTTVIALPDTVTTNQGDEILSVLNPWMASLPGAFSNVNI